MRRSYLQNWLLVAAVKGGDAFVGVVLTPLRIAPADGSTDDLGQAQEMGKEPRVMDVGGRGYGGRGYGGRGYGGRGYGGQRDAVGRDHHVVLGPGLAPIRRVRARKFAATLGPDRAAVDDHVPRRPGRQVELSAPDGLDGYPARCAIRD